MLLKRQNPCDSANAPHEIVPSSIAIRVTDGLMLAGRRINQMIRNQPGSQSQMIPIIDKKRRIIGWSKESPYYVAGVLHHPEAEDLLGGAVIATFVQIDGEEAAKAGAPPNWPGPWRCIGLCPPSVAEQLHGDFGTIRTAA
jgi:hypothetical protein